MLSPEFWNNSVFVIHSCGTNTSIQNYYWNLDAVNEWMSSSLQTNGLTNQATGFVWLIIIISLTPKGSSLNPDRKSASSAGSLIDKNAAQLVIVCYISK